MGIQVFSTAPKVNPPYVTWGGACGVYRGFSVYVYDTNRPRPGGNDDPYSDFYKYYPAEGAIVKAKFYDPESGWTYTDIKEIPPKDQQPEYETVAWVQVGCTVPCDVCKGRRDFYVSCDLSVEYKGFKWSKRYPKLMHITCPYPGNPDFFTVESGKCWVENGKVCAEFWLSNSVSYGEVVTLALYVKDEVWRAVKFNKTTVFKYKRKVCFDLRGVNGVVGIAPITDYPDDSWVCGTKWVIKR